MGSPAYDPLDLSHPSHGDAQLRLMADSMPVPLAYYEATGLRCVFASQRYTRYIGQPMQDAIGKTAREHLGEATWQAIQPHLERTLRGERVQYTREHTRSDGEARMMEIRLIPHFAPDPGAQQAPLLGVFALINDITHHWEAERRVRQSEERMRKFAAATEEGIVLHRGGVIIDANEALQRLLGHPLDEIAGRRVLDFISPEHHDTVREYSRQERETPYEITLRHRAGHAIPVEAIAKTMPQTGADYRVVVVRDITARRQAIERENFLALHDPLTQLPNRHHLTLLLTRLLAEAQQAHRPLAVLFIDVDHFKTVNESLGHGAGDAVLREAARRLRDGLRPTDFLCRVGGDQFVALLPDTPDRSAAARTTEALRARLGAAYTLGGVPLALSASTGICLFPEDGYAPDELLRHATTAMHHAKESERGAHAFYAPGMEGRPADLLHLEHQLREAIFHEAFELHYQPQVRVDTGALVGFEALVRWRHPERGLVGPDAFIPLAESRGLISPIGRWVLREACRQTRAWHDAGLPRVPVAVNLSAIEFRQRDVAGDIAAVLRQTGLEPRYLDVEITESALMQQPGQARATLQALRDLGVLVTVDDFGTGYSSLAYLKRYPIDRLKVDRSFVTDTPADSDDVAIVTAIIQLAHSLQLQAVAEGVETSEQLALLRRLGCDLAQGYLISRPMDAAAARRWLEDNHTHSSPPTPP
ncbi:MAG: EAL domain-containing protein [Acidovorax sp.]|uniref:putative bifunctional diguanylate cyclase/phosphodiesterase n=1 Tax=Acidovorax sp. TaxID=1872122 RepID=UPI0039E6BE37